jgi:hypothetical protein
VTRSRRIRAHHVRANISAAAAGTLLAVAVAIALAPAAITQHPAERGVSHARAAATGRAAIDVVAYLAAGHSRARLPVPTATHIAPGTSLSSVRVQAGHAYAFERGATYTGTLNVNADNVTIESYGSGKYPVFTRSTHGDDIRVSGNGDHISNIRLTGKGYQAVPRCGPARTAGYEIGIDITGAGDRISSVYAYGNLYAGIYVETAGSHATISGSVFNGVDSLNPSSLGSGAFGILIWGAHNTITHNIFRNQNACSPEFGRDGSGVEIYRGSYNLIQHNTGQNDIDFTELGGRGATTNTYLDNAFRAPGEFLVTRGSGDAADGPARNTILVGNVAHGAVVSYDWRAGDGTLLTMKDNHVTSLSQDGGYVNEGGNLIGF